MVIVRPARIDDAEQIAPLHVSTWAEAYGELIDPELLAQRAARPMEDRIAMWRDRIAANPTFVAEDGDGRIVGFATAGPDLDDPSTGLQVMTLYVTAATYGQGVGHRLLLAAIGDQPAHLWVLEGNDRAIRFYQRQGFRLDGGYQDDPPWGRDLRMVRP